MSLDSVWGSSLHLLQEEFLVLKTVCFVQVSEDNIQNFLSAANVVTYIGTHCSTESG